MNTFKKIHHLQVADFKERTRTYKFLVVLVLTILGASFIIPPANQDGGGMHLLINSNYQAVYNSSFVGTASALMTALILSFFGFYLVNNSIEHDDKTGVGQIIAATSIRKGHYLLGKMLSNFMVLLSIAVTSSFVTIIIYFFRGQAPINFWQLLAPFLFIVIPTIFLVSALAVLFETISWLKGSTGNIVYFFVWMVILVLEASAVESNVNTLDTLGLKMIINSINNSCPELKGSAGLNWFYGDVSNLKTILWEGIHWNQIILVNKLTIIMVSFCIVLMSQCFFKRFDSSKTKNKINKKISFVKTIDEDIKETISIPSSSISVNKLTVVSQNFDFLSMVNSELHLMLKGMKWWWILIEFGLIIACFFAPIDIAQNYILPFAWLLPISIWSSMGCKEKLFNTEQLIFSSPKSASRQIPACLLAGFLVTVLTGSGFGIKLVILGNWNSLVAFIASSFLIPAAALTMGVLTNSNKLFEVSYLLIWYLGHFGRIYYLDFMDFLGEASLLKAVSHFIVVIILLRLSVLLRKFKIQNK